MIISNDKSIDPNQLLQDSLIQTSNQWSKFNLDSKRPTFDKYSSTSKEYRETSQAARKVLAENTKRFKKTFKAVEAAISVSSSSSSSEATTNTTNSSTERLSAHLDDLSKECKSILKAYQDEIDLLTKRFKTSDSALLELSKSLSELNDPSSLLSEASQHLASKTGQVTHLLKGMEEIQNEMENKCHTLTSQLDSSNYELQIVQKTLEEEKKIVLNLQKQLDDLKKVNSNTQAQIQLNNIQKEEKEELIALRKEVAEYEAEFKMLKNQDITIKKLNARIEEMSRNSEEELQRELKKAQEHLAQTEGRRATEALEREAILERRLASLELELKAERAGREVTQAHLLEADEGLSQREAAWEAQRQILLDDADRMREELYSVKKERDDFCLRCKVLEGDDEEEKSLLLDGQSDRREVSSVNEGVNGMTELILERKAYEAEVSDLAMNLASMRDELRAKDEEIVELQSSFQTTVDSLENEQKILTEKIVRLEYEVSSAPSIQEVESMRRELRILKNLEYNASEQESNNDSADSTLTSNDSNKESKGNNDLDLESVLIGKLRKLEATLVKERREKADQYTDYVKLQKEYELVEKAKIEAEALTSRLEADLEKAIAVPSNTPKLEKSPEIVINFSQDTSTLQQILDPSTPIITKPTPPVSENTLDTNVDTNSMTTIVMAQRDRLRARCDVLEAERDSFKSELQLQVANSESLKADNSVLYEKVRYLQSYNSNNLNTSGGGIHSRQDRDIDLEALEARYEASMDPFRQFSRTERQRKMKEMSPMERTVFIVAKTVLGSKEMRTGLFFYVLGMHLLVFVTTYHWSHGCSSGPAYSEVAHFHGGAPQPEIGP